MVEVGNARCYNNCRRPTGWENKTKIDRKYIMQIENDLGKDDIKKLVVRIALPSMLAQFVSVLYSIVDRMYIGNIPQIGDTALAGVGVCGPIVNLISAIAFLVGFGGSPLMSIHMGEKKEAAAKQILANSFFMLSVLSIVFMGIALLLKDRMLLWFGASEATFSYANEYFTIYLLGTIFAVLSVGMNQFIICQGFAKVGMKSVLLGAVLNIILDPVFIFVFHMDVAGAALATVLSQVASCAYVLLFLFGKRVPIRITFGNYSLKIMRRIFSIGFTPFIIIAIDNVMIIAMNAVLQHYGGAAQGDMMVTCATIVQSFMLMITMPLGGITGGTQTILGYNYGACLSERVLKAERYIMLLCFLFAGVMFLFAQTIPQYFVRIFTQNETYVQTSVWAIKVYTLGVIPLSLQYPIVDGFTAIGVVKLSLPLSLFRKVLFFSSVFLLPVYFGVTAVFYAEPISDILGASVSIVVYLLMIRKILRQRESQVLLYSLASDQE